MKNQTNVPKKFRTTKRVLIASAFIFVFVVCLGFAQLISGIIIPASTQVSQNLASPTFKLYFISLNKSQLEASAHTLAADYQKIGAGGYVWLEDDYYHVIASCYEKENDAVLVQNNIKLNQGLDSELFSVNFSGLALAGEYEAEGKKVLVKALKSFYLTYQSLFDIAVSLDTNVYNDISARLAVNSTYSNLNSIYSDYKTIFLDAEKDTLKLLNRHLGKATQILENLCSGKPINQGQTYSSLIKYRYLQLLSTYQDFLKSF